jgi:hypothetical protein
VKKFFNGPEAFTPDADFLLGETDVAASGSRPAGARTALPARAASAR